MPDRIELHDDIVCQVVWWLYQQNGAVWWLPITTRELGGTMEWDNLALVHKDTGDFVWYHSQDAIVADTAEGHWPGEAIVIDVAGTIADILEAEIAVAIYLTEDHRNDDR